MSVVTDNDVSSKKAAKFKFVFITTFGPLFSEEKSGNGKKSSVNNFPRYFSLCIQIVT
jgi:hypothetical protein